MSTDTTHQADTIQFVTLLYDSIMAAIDDDLTISILSQLDTIYANETPDEHKKRMHRYQLAYAEFDKVIAEFSNNMHEKIHAYQRQIFKNQEEENTSRDQTVMTKLLSAFK